MIEKPTSFYSEGALLQASFYLPDGHQETDEPLPVLIVNSGYQGFNEFYPKMFAEFFTERGFACFGFDYRGMAQSEGPKGTVLLEQQVEDIRNAITFTQTSPIVHSRRIGLLGWGMGAANVVIAAGVSREVHGVVAMNGFYDGERWLKSIHTFDEWRRILGVVREDRVRRVIEGESLLADTFEHYPLDPATSEYVRNELEQVPGFGHQTRLQFTESIINMNAERVADRLEGIPLFIAHGIDNTLHPFEEAEALYAAASSPKHLYKIAGRHNDFMYVSNPVFVEMCNHIEKFLVTAFDASMNDNPLRSA
jgi:pimeloyl-ACP methyl ester carboxylesterase